MWLFMPHLYPGTRSHVFMYQLEHEHYIIINDTCVCNCLTYLLKVSVAFNGKNIKFRIRSFSVEDFAFHIYFFFR